MQKLVVLLTACINTGNVVHIKRRDPDLRLQDYVKSLQSWLSIRGPLEVVFCESSGFSVSKMELLCQQTTYEQKVVELVVFQGQQYAAEFGKGYGEMETIRYALQHAKLLRGAEYVVKVTGRLFVQNGATMCEAIIAGKKADIFCDFRQNMTWADSRVFCATSRFLNQFLLPTQGLINDSRGFTFEHALGRAAHLAIADGYQWAMLPVAPDLRGIAATANIQYTKSRLSFLKRECFRRVKSYVLSR